MGSHGRSIWIPDHQNYFLIILQKVFQGKKLKNNMKCHNRNNQFPFHSIAGKMKCFPFLHYSAFFRRINCDARIPQNTKRRLLPRNYFCFCIGLILDSLESWRMLPNAYEVAMIWTVYDRNCLSSKKSVSSCECRLTTFHNRATPMYISFNISLIWHFDYNSLQNRVQSSFSWHSEKYQWRQNSGHDA